MFKAILLKIKNINLSTLLVIVFAILVIFAYVTFIVVNMSLNMTADESESIYQAEQSLKQTSDYIQAKCENTINALSSFAISEHLQELIQQPLSLYENNNQRWLDDKAILNKMLARSMAYTDIKDFFVYFDNGLSQLRRNTSDFINSEDVKDEAWFKDFSSNPSIYTWYPYDVASDSYNYISSVRKILNPNNLNSSIGYIQAVTPKQIFTEILETGRVTHDTQAIIINSKGVEISKTSNYSMQSDTLYDYIYSNISANEYNEDVCFEIEINEKSYLVGINRINFSDWHYIQLTPYASIKTLSSRSLKQLYYVTIIAIPLFILFILIFSKYSSRRIHSVIGSLDAIAEEHIIDNSDYVKGKNDFDNLKHSVNMMVKRLDVLLGERYKMGMEIKALEIKTLQAQINPHFLYNSLSMINNMGINNNVPEISIMVSSLAKFYNLSLSKGHNIITIASEIEIVQSYISIQNIRFHDCAKFLIDVPIELMHYKTPKIILQPIVENALWHGILGSESQKGIIKLSVKNDKGDILFTISDNGAGMSDEKLKNILLQETDDTLHGYGIKNINDRLAIMYGKGYGLSFSSVLGKGTEVYIRIPQILD